MFKTMKYIDTKLKNKMTVNINN